MDFSELEDDFPQLEPILEPFEYSVPDFIPAEDYSSTVSAELAATPVYSDTSTKSQPQIVVENGRAEDERPEVSGKKAEKNRLKRKIERTKQKFPEKRKLIDKEGSEPTKKQLQLLRNRISAQRSRDRKKQELSELSNENQRLRENEAQLQAQLYEAQSEIELNKQILNKLSETSRNEYCKLRNELLCSHEGRYSRSYYRNPLLIATALLGTICMVALMSSAFVGNSGQSELAPRILVEKAEVPKEYSITELM
eukprot:TRINITY_DN5662_c0_g2_i1.p1 TRINITY_DN5662_c0_g2~~TRINITY_DN5662_c0_g2_i1.p1  ORF type:complete len:253 (-),score=55.33 TRINITY_DN5662_c0_g2_i1:497-1255(-)